MSDLTYSEVNFTKNKDKGDAPPSAETVYSEVKISKSKQSVGSGWKSKVSPDRVVLVVLLALLAAAVIIIVYLLSHINVSNLDQTNQSLREEIEALRKNLSAFKAKPTCPTYPSCPPPSCPPPESHNQTCLQCGAGWELHRGKCYKFSTNTKNWKESRSFCRDVGGDLVKIDSREEQEYLVGKLKNLIKNQNVLFWIELTDSETEGSWLWADRSPLDESLSFWSPGQPNSLKGNKPGDEDCVKMVIRKESDLETWHDYPCNDPSRFICEKAPRSAQSSCV